MLLWGKITKYSQYEEMFDTLRRRNITTAQMHLMLMLASRGDEWTSMQDLVNKMQKTRNLRVVQSSVSRAIQNLGEKNRYGRDGHDVLETKGDTEDGRLLMFRLNRKGMKMINDLTMKLQEKEFAYG